MKTDKSIDVKWMTPENYESTTTLKQHAFIPKTCKERWTLEEYPGNASLCNTGYATDDESHAANFYELEDEILNESRACKKCLKTFTKVNFMKTDKTDKMEQILSRRYVIDKGFNGGNLYIYNSMQEHTDQAIEEYKVKVIKDLMSRPSGLINRKLFIEIINSTTI